MITEYQLSILRHSLGLDSKGYGPIYRNHFFPGDKDIGDCEHLEEVGLMRSRPDPFAPNHMVYHVTTEGKEKAKEQQDGTIR